MGSDLGYPDFVLATVVVGYSLTFAVLGALGMGFRASVGVGSLISAGVLLHAMFVNSPPYASASDRESRKSP